MGRPSAAAPPTNEMKLRRLANSERTSARCARYFFQAAERPFNWEKNNERLTAAECWAWAVKRQPYCAAIAMMTAVVIVRHIGSSTKELLAKVQGKPLGREMLEWTSIRLMQARAVLLAVDGGRSGSFARLRNEHLAERSRPGLRGRPRRTLLQ